MISLEDLNPHKFPTTPEIDTNLQDLFVKINKIRLAWNKAMWVTSGLRSEDQQQKLIAAGKSNAPKSHHLEGRAVDILDQDGSLYDWCKANEETLETAGLWCEERQGNWQHFQTCPPVSGKRWFIP